jgi:putative hemolysin
MLPKSIAVLKPRKISAIVSLPLSFAVRVVDPMMPLLQSINLISRRLVWPGFQAEPFMEVSDLERAIEHSGKDAALIKQEQAVLQNIVQLSTIRVEEWMRPRTQFVSFRPPVQLADLKGSIPASGYLLITEPDSREIEKAIRLDNQYQLDEKNLDRFAEPVMYLPWCATVADALEKMSHRDREVTVVVNEFGDTIGVLTIEDILETVFVYSPSRSERLLDMPPLEKTSEATWRVAGIMSLRQLARRLEVAIPDTTSVTVGGIIQETMQRLAEPADQCVWPPFKFRVIEVAQRGSMLVEVRVIESEDVQP